MGVDLLSLTADLVDLGSVSHHEGLLTDHLESLLREVSWLTVERVDDNVVARTDLGRDTRVILAGHTDTVPASGNEQARRDGDTVWGLGSADMKSGLAVMLVLAQTLSEPALDVSYVFYAGEEVAAHHNGLGHLFARRPDLLAGDVALLGEPTDAAIEAGCQGTMRARLVLGGYRAHTARPWMGRNAVHRLAPVLSRLAAYEERRPVLDGCEFREAMQAVGVESGVAGNVVPDRAVLTVNHRFAPDRTPAAAEAHLRHLLGADELDAPAGDTFEIVDMAPAAAPSLAHPVLATMVERYALGVSAKLGWTDVARFAAHGIPAANFGPGDATLAHTADEHVGRAAIERTHAVLEDLLTRGV